jgi:hypothetical protein
MPDRNQSQLEAQQEALDAWAKLPQGKPSRNALPPAGGGLGHLFGWFMNITDAVSTRWLVLALIVVGAVVVAYFVLR